MVARCLADDDLLNELAHDVDEGLFRFRIHEAGHAVVHNALRLRPIHGLNIDTPGGGGYSRLGFTTSGSDTLGYREDMLAMFMAGRAAEQIVVGQVSSGSAGNDESDLARATKLALAMERSLGFGAIQPLLHRDNKDPTGILDGNPDLAARIHARLETALARAVEIIIEDRDKLDALIKALFDAQALDAEAVIRIMGT